MGHRVTLVPAMAEKAAHVTMLQRSPTWMMARPSVDPISTWLRRRLPLRLALRVTRSKNVLMGMYVFRLCRRSPQRMRELLLGGVRQALGPKADLTARYVCRLLNHMRETGSRQCLAPSAGPGTLGGSRAPVESLRVTGDEGAQSHSGIPASATSQSER